VRLIATDLGLFRLEGNTLTYIEVTKGRHVDWIVETGRWESGARLIAAKEGLFQQWQPHVPARIRSPGRSDVSLEETSRLIWEFESPCAEFVPSESFRVVETETDAKIRSQITARLLDEHLNTLDVIATWGVVDREDGEEIALHLEYTWPPGSDNWTTIEGSETTVRVGWSLFDYVLDYSKRLGPWFLGTHTLLFGGLLVAARRSERSWRALADPTFGKVGAWFWAAVRQMPCVQRWVMDRWFQQKINEDVAQPYVAVPLRGPSEATEMSSNIAALIAPGISLWLQGGPGMGKTALIQNILHAFYAGPEGESLTAAKRRVGYIPILLTLRDFSGVPVPKNDPETWLFELVGRSLDSEGFTVTDKSVLKGLITSGQIVLLLDGANEVAADTAIVHFARRYGRHTGLLVTSQSDPAGQDAFELWRLPKSLDSVAKELLQVFLGDDTLSTTVHDSIQSSPIRAHIRSGYDLQLIADLVEGGTEPADLPETRIGLYDAMLSRLRADGDLEYPQKELAKIAWGSFVSDKRKLVEGEEIPTELLAPLTRRGVRIVRTLGGAFHEFRHDHMRGYLAAHWAATEAVDPVSLFEEDAAVWTLGRSDQEVVWSFVAELIGSDRGPRILDWSRREPERSVLQVALNEVSIRDSWKEHQAANPSSPPP